MSAAASGHKGNKAALASKPCAVCGRPMSWRRAWAKNWEAVRYCSQACRKNRNKAKSQVGAWHDEP
ncbi:MULTISPECIES: DUF2256 domain-containing protein [unclassified Thiomonas]|uniref:DUF2256 domain-containing protein n=1 Tax=unclassified Thiomonas TaxID=2625466 RepID=UPI000B1B5381|nr:MULTISPECIES: DUF2256 domain-containing protein [unclassified Thiomonas]MDE2174600.1 DUF2256 domain-containing protein [Betaproteobacteria bacterium]OYV31074.1 MAG: hypothetical protein B7Z79_04185 [Thiomonas sp. 20-64-9]